MDADSASPTLDPRLVAPYSARKTGRRSLSRNELYGRFLLSALFAYAVAGKGFAYVGLAPIYVSEILLAWGMLTFFRTRAFLATLTTLPCVLMTALLVLVVVRTVPFIGTYGMDAPRDSVIVVYCLYALIVAGLLLEQPWRVLKIVQFVRWLTSAYVFVGPAAYMTGQIGALGILPTLPGSPVPIIFLRPGELAVHLCGCAVMAIVRLRSANIVWTIMLFAGIGVVAAQNRGGFLAILVPVTLALVIKGRWRLIVTSLIAVSFTLAFAYVTDIAVPTSRDDGRSIGARQIVDNLTSLLAPSKNSDLANTTRWREDWWKAIANYTFDGPYFWTGKGFGLNLAEADGFLGTAFPDLRSPHNSNLTILARCGVPGIVLWISFLVSWSWMVLTYARQAWSFHDGSWGDLLLLTGCYWLSILIDASFDVVLEGPMLGVWFWSLTGFGLAIIMIIRNDMRTLRRTPSAGLHQTRWFI